MRPVAEAAAEPSPKPDEGRPAAPPLAEPVTSAVVDVPPLVEPETAVGPERSSPKPAAAAAPAGPATATRAEPVRPRPDEFSPPDWPVPRWITAPFFRLPIPNSPLGRGNPGRLPAKSPSLEPAPPSGATAIPLVPAEPVPISGGIPDIVEPEPISASDEVRPVGSSATEIGLEEASIAAGLPDEVATRKATGGQSGNAASPEAIETDLGLPVDEPPPALIEPDLETAASPGPAASSELAALHNRRHYQRTALAAAIEIDGAPAKLIDLSIGGFAATNAPPKEPGAIATVGLRLSIDGIDIGTRIRARIIYCDAPRTGGRFVDLTASQAAFLRYIVTWRGGAAGSLGATALLEAIGRSPPRETPALPPDPASGTRRPPWWSRLLGRLRPSRGPA